MTDTPAAYDSSLSRRSALKTAAAAAALSSVGSRAFAGEDNEVRVALVGCGGRGTGAAANALTTQQNGSAPGGVKLVAMADAFGDRLSRSREALTAKFGDQVDVPEDQRFVGFEGYRDALAALRPQDILILATPPAFRWVHFRAAIDHGCHVFMEKPVTVDGPTSRRMLELSKESQSKGMKVGVGLMCRHCDARQELFDRIQNGEIGDLTLLRSYRMSGPTASAFSLANDGSMPEVEYQIRNFHSFLWASGGAVSDFMIHNIDECCWMKDAWPVEAQAVGGRHYRGDYVDQNFDSYGIEYTFADGSKLMADVRCMAGAHKQFASYAHGTKGSAIISKSGHSPARCRTFSTQSFDNDATTWKYGKKEGAPHQLEWDDLMTAIKNDEPFHEVDRGVEASLVTSMGRMAAHTGKVITYGDMLNCDHEFAPDVDQLTADGPAPLITIGNGRYPIPAPGIITDREY